MNRITALLILITLIPDQLLGWGPKGHTVVAGPAQSKLSSTTGKNIRLLLGNGDLAAVSLWADDNSQATR